MNSRPEPGSAFVATGAAEQMYAGMWPGMVRLGHLLTGSVADGEDLAQDGYLGLLRAWPVEHPEAYVRRVMVNGAINAGKRRRRSSRLPQPVITTEPVAPDDTWPVVQRLPPRQRAVIVLRYYLDLSEADIATTLGCRPGTVKAHASKGLVRLRKELS